MKTLLRGGIVVSGAGMIPADVLIDGETVAAVGDLRPEADTEVVDVSGKLLFPGFIDAHTHFELFVCNTVTADDFYTGGRAALRGGTTMVIDFASPGADGSLQTGLADWHRKAEKRGCACDYGFHMTIESARPEVFAEIPQMFAQGVSSFKMYMTYASRLSDHDLFLALQQMKRCGGIAGVHCENSGVIDALIEQNKAAGNVSPAAHPASRPAELEAEAVARLLKLAAVVDVPVVIVHLSSEAGLYEVRAARARGQKVYVETCPQYLYLDDSRYDLPDFEGGRYVCAPPLRKPADQAALWKALAADEIQTVSTDHCSFTLAQKDAGRGDFTKIPGGLPGVETRGLLLYTAVAAGRITAVQMCRVLSENPAKLYGVYPRKGVIAAGSDADIVVLDPHGHGVITAADQLANVDYSPYEGMPVQGRIDAVYLRGRLSVQDGAVLCDNGGSFVERRRGDL